MDCVFCKIIAGEIPSTFLYRDDKMIIIKDIDPRAKIHYLAMPIGHYARIEEMTPHDEANVGYMLRKISSLQKELGISDGYRLVINQGDSAGQSVQHLHVHILGGQTLEFTDLREKK